MSKRTVFPRIAGIAAVFVLLSASTFAGCAASPDTSPQPLEASVSQGIARLGYLWPLFVQGRITSRHGQRTHPIRREADYHMGVDISVPHGASIRAARAGRSIPLSSGSSTGRRQSRDLRREGRYPSAGYRWMYTQGLFLMLH